MNSSPAQRPSRSGRLTALLVAALMLVPAAWAQDITAECGHYRYEGQFGPFDYRKQRGALLKDVEQHHFRPEVEALVRGITISTPIGAEISYTLVRFPNHHRALVSLVRLGEKTSSQQPKGTRWSVDCYFRRALRFASDDTVVRLLYAQFLGNQKRLDLARFQLESAMRESGDNPLTQYNIGLVYFELGDHERALAQAWTAMSLGMQRPELQAMLMKAGKWRDPPR